MKNCVDTRSDWRSYYMVCFLLKKSKPMSGCPVSCLPLGTLTWPQSAGIFATLDFKLPQRFSVIGFYLAPPREGEVGDP